MTKEYVMVTCIQQFKIKYAVSVDRLKDENGTWDADWAKDLVTCNDLDELSQKDIGETIVDCEVVTEEKLLEVFDKENDYLAGWEKDQKLYWIESTYNENNG